MAENNAGGLYDPYVKRGQTGTAEQGGSRTENLQNVR